MAASYTPYSTPSVYEAMRHPVTATTAGGIAVPLSQGYFTLIDEADLPLISPYKWHVSISPDRRYFRARTNLPLPKESSGQTSMLMHTLLTGFRWTRHLNGNLLDNRRANLAEIDPEFKGATWVDHCGKWSSQIIRNHHRYHLGLYDTAAEAARAYDHTAVSEFGDYAGTNAALGLLSHESCGDCPARERAL